MYCRLSNQIQMFIKKIKYIKPETWIQKPEDASKSWPEQDLSHLKINFYRQVKKQHVNRLEANIDRKPISPVMGPMTVQNPKIHDKTYRWCSCGQSLKQPFCDGSHKGTDFKPKRQIQCSCADANLLQIDHFVMESDVVNQFQHNTVKILKKIERYNELQLKMFLYIEWLFMQILAQSFYSQFSYVYSNQLKANTSDLLINNILILKNIQFIKRFMESSQVPDPRFKQFEERLNGQGKAIGFTLPGNTFFFEYDEQGGWVDQNGKYFNSDGIPEDDQPSEQEEEEEILGDEDQEMVYQFQKMLIQEQQGIVYKKQNKPEQQAPKQVYQPPSSQSFNFQEQTLKLLQKYKNNQQIREGLPAQVFVYFKMRGKFFQRTIPQVQKKQSVLDKNNIIKSIKQSISKRRQQLIKSNPWLGESFFLDYSGSSDEESAYDRYWYGYVKVSHQKYLTVAQGLKKSTQFALLKSKTYFAFKSKFYLKKTMKQTIDKLKTQLKQIPQENSVSVTLNNLPQNFSLSTVVDLIYLSGGLLQDLEDIDVIDQFAAKAIVKKRTAQKLANVQGYCHDFKQYIWLQFADEKRASKNGTMYSIKVDSQLKMYDRQTGDTLALQRSAKELVKCYEKPDEFRFVVGIDALVKLLMYRGQSINIIRISLFEKMIKTNQET